MKPELSTGNNKLAVVNVEIKYELTASKTTPSRTIEQEELANVTSSWLGISIQCGDKSFLDSSVGRASDC
jgi:hypothetical protein